MRNLNHVIAAPPANRRANVTARGQKLIAEEKALRQLREARRFTQQNLAESLGIDQSGVSKLEKRTDMMISTLRSFVEAMGGELHLTVSFPDGSVEVAKLAELGESELELGRKGKKPEVVDA